MTDIPVEAFELQNAYLTSDIVSIKYATDALHVAIATVTNCPIIVSWNFRHIVHFDKIVRYNEVNEANGFHSIAIHSPQEVSYYDNEN